METLAERIRWILDARTLSERGLAQKAGLKSETHIGLILNPKPGKKQRPAAETLRKIAAAGGVHLDWLASGTGPRELTEHVVEDDRIHPVIAEVAKESNFTTYEASLASMSIRGLSGTAGMTQEQAYEFLMKARMTRRDNERALTASRAAPMVPVEPGLDDDIGGGAGDVPDLTSRTKTKKRR